MKHHKFSSVESGHDTSFCGCCYCSRKIKTWTCALCSTLLIVLIVFISGIAIRAALLEDPFELKTLDANPSFLDLSSQEILETAQRLGEAIRIQTVSYNETVLNITALELFHEYIRTTFPNVFNSSYIDVTVVNEHSLLLRVEGSLATRNPYLLCGHIDVVPEGNGDWSRNPFSGEIYSEDGEEFIFGRGTIDDKQAVLAILENLNRLQQDGNQPSRTFYVAFGHDEEVSGHQGAAHISTILKQKLIENGEELSFILDEGMFVMDKVFPGVTDPIAYVGVVEKGWANVQLSVRGVQGHSSTPPKESAVGILAHGMAKLEDNRQPSRFGDGVEYDTIAYVAPYASFGYKMVLGNLWIFKDIVSMILKNDHATDAIQRTTTAITVVKAGIKVNVIPSQATALINHRVHPADTVEEVVQYDKDVIDDSRINVELLDSFPATKVSSYSSDSMSFQIIVNSAYEIYPNAHVTPGVMVANTDTKHYQNLCDSIYRFQPVLLSKSDLSRFHGTDERISIKNYIRVVEFYNRLIQNADQDVIKRPPNNDDLLETLMQTTSSEELDDFYDIQNVTLLNDTHDEN